MWDGRADSYGDTCADYVGNPTWCGSYDDYDFTSNEMCCACGGGSSCQDTDNGALDSYGDGCEYYTESPEVCGVYDDYDFTSYEMCCACGGGSHGNTPSTPSPTPTPSPTTDEGSCQDTDNGASDSFGDTCSDYTSNPSWCGSTAD